jgi:hypothetical protein
VKNQQRHLKTRELTLTALEGAAADKIAIGRDSRKPISTVAIASRCRGDGREGQGPKLHEGSGRTGDGISTPGSSKNRVLFILCGDAHRRVRTRVRRKQHQESRHLWPQQSPRLRRTSDSARSCEHAWRQQPRASGRALRGQRECPLTLFEVTVRYEVGRQEAAW